MKKYFEVPTQVRFIEENVGSNYGIAYQDHIICACCGAVIDFNDYEEGELIIDVEYDTWVDFAAEIGEEE